MLPGAYPPASLHIPSLRVFEQATPEDEPESDDGRSYMETVSPPVGQLNFKPLWPGPAVPLAAIPLAKVVMRRSGFGGWVWVFMPGRR